MVWMAVLWRGVLGANLARREDRVLGEELMEGQTTVEFVELLRRPEMLSYVGRLLKEDIRLPPRMEECVFVALKLRDVEVERLQRKCHKRMGRLLEERIRVTEWRKVAELNDWFDHLLVDMHMDAVMAMYSHLKVEMRKLGTERRKLRRILNKYTDG